MNRTQGRVENEVTAQGTQSPQTVPNSARTTTGERRAGLPFSEISQAPRRKHGHFAALLRDSKHTAAVNSGGN